MSDIFEKAVRQKLRFVTLQGVLTTEDLFDLPLTTTKANGNSLDKIAIALDTELKTQNVSFVSDTTPKNTETQLKFDLVKYVIDTIKAENAARAEAAARSVERRRVLEELARRNENKISTMSDEELEAKLASL